ncbi:MAG: glycosyltransferase family 39 protein [Candidatus Brocadiales bacterium]|nr:glycosyltransferase family 39 protein [Candidatus Brocadiales bacterium]
MQDNSRRKRIYYQDIILLILVSILVIFPALGQNRHWSSREIRHAEIIREMSLSGDYLVPKLLGETYYDKPPVMHAMAAILTRVIGEPSMTIARTPSAIAGLLGVLATYGVGLILLDRRTALLGAIALLGMPGYSIMARHARPDMILCALILFSCLCLGLGMRERRNKSRVFYFALAGLLAGFGVVTKGPYGVIVPILFAIFVPFRRQDLKRPRIGWIIFAIGLLTVLAMWAIPAYLRDNGEYLRGVIFQRDLDVREGGNPERKHFYYAWVGLINAIPLTFFLPLAIADLRRRGYSASLAIAGAIFTIISFIPKKRQHYLLPVYPFLALGVAASIVRHSGTSKLVRRAAWVLIPLSIIAMPLYYTVVQPIMHPSEDSDMVFSKEVLNAIEPDAKLYCVKSEEALAWVGRQHERILRLNVDSSAIKILQQAKSNSYLVIDEKNLTALLKITGPLPTELVFHRKVDHDEIMLFRLKKSSFDVP